MSSINFATKEIVCKIVYYGPALSGKTTNLSYIHSQVPTNQKSGMISLATEGDRTLYFDFLPLETAVLKGFKTKFQLYTVPGQVYYNATRKLVLRGVDGIVLVADSQWERQKASYESFMNMFENLKEYDYDINDIPYILQYNKRDLPNIAPPSYMDFLLNRREKRVPTFLSIAINGEGVFTTLNTICKLVLVKLAKEGIIEQEEGG